MANTQHTSIISHQCLFTDPDTGYECPRDAGDYPFCKPHNYKIHTENRCYNCCKVKPIPQPGQISHKLCAECFRTKRDTERQKKISSGYCINYPKCDRIVTQRDIDNGSRGRCEICYCDYMKNVHHEIIHYDPLPDENTSEHDTKHIDADIAQQNHPILSHTSKRSRKEKKVATVSDTTSSHPKLLDFLGTTPKSVTPGIGATFWGTVPDVVRQAPQETSSDNKNTQSLQKEIDNIDLFVPKDE